VQEVPDSIDLPWGNFFDWAPPSGSLGVAFTIASAEPARLVAVFEFDGTDHATLFAAIWLGARGVFRYRLTAPACLPAPLLALNIALAALHQNHPMSLML